MKLQTNNSHKKIDLRKLILTKNNIRTAAFGLSMLTIFSGSTITTKAAENNRTEVTSEVNTDYSDISDNTYIDIPDIHKRVVAEACGKEEDSTITVGDLRNIKGSITLSFVDDSSLEWLNYCDNIETLEFYFRTDNTEMFKNIISIKNLKNIRFYNSDYSITLTLNEDDFSFLKKCSKLESLKITGMDIPKGFIENLSNLKTLYLSSIDYDNVDVDLSKLTFLDELSFGGGVYDVAIKLNSEEYKTLVKNGVAIEIYNDEDNKKLEDINSRLDSIIETLDVDKDSSDQEKLDAILIYVLENLSYDKEVASEVATTADGNRSNDALVKSFYKEGDLYGALEKDTAICGNYAALVSALSDRLDLNTYYITSYNHAWNLVSVEGIYYYVDATWLDGQGIVENYVEEYDESGNIINITFDEITAEEAIKEGRASELNWYMEDPTKDYSTTHDNVTDIPSFVEIKPIDATNEIELKEENIESIENVEENIESIDNKKFKIQIGKKTFIVGGGILVGIMSGLGLAHIAKKKKNKRKQKFNQQSSNSNDNNFGYYASGDYGFDSSFDFYSDNFENHKKR